MKQRLVVGNWKLHKTCHEARLMVHELAQSPIVNGDAVQCIVAPPHTALFAAAQSMASSKLGLCAQNIHRAPFGAYTGEVSAPMVHEAGARFVIVGHSERRTLFNETDHDVAAKLVAAATAHLTPILCVGETAEHKQKQQTQEVVQGQVRAACQAYLAQEHAPLMVAYEPVWAIGTGATPAPEDAARVHALIYEALQGLNAAKADSIPLLYGGSVKASNAASFVALPHVHGVLVGGASLQVASFVAIAQAVAQA